jgi:hypothetical protein
MSHALTRANRDAIARKLDPTGKARVFGLGHDAGIRTRMLARTAVARALAHGHGTEVVRRTQYGTRRCDWWWMPVARVAR